MIKEFDMFLREIGGWIVYGCAYICTEYMGIWMTIAVCWMVWFMITQKSSNR